MRVIDSFNGCGLYAVAADSAKSAGSAASAKYDTNGSLIANQDYVSYNYVKLSSYNSFTATSSMSGTVENCMQLSTWLPAFYYQKTDTSSKDELSAAFANVTGGGGGGGGTSLTGDAQGAVDTVISKSATWNSVSSKLPNSAYLVIGTSNNIPTANNVSVFVQGKSNSAKMVSQMVANNIFLQGSNCSASEGNAFAQGTNCHAETNCSLAQGSNCSASYGISQGMNCQSTNSLAQGSGCYGSKYSLSQGYSCSAYSGSIAQGSGCSAKNFSQSLGLYNVITDYGMAIGKYNETSSNAAFVIGNGDSTANRSDLFVIDKTGNVSSKSGYFYDKDGRVGNYHRASATVTNNGTNFTITLSSNNSYVVLDNSAVSGDQALNITIVPPTLEQDELLDCMVQFKPIGGQGTSGHTVSASGLTQVGVRKLNLGGGVNLNYIRPNETAQVRLLGNTYCLM